MKKKALLVGCNYPGQDNELVGCCNDARRLCTLLKTRFGFPGENIDVLVDDNPGTDQSTHANIRKYLEKLVGDVQSGDILVFSFSGHGKLLGVRILSLLEHVVWIPSCLQLSFLMRGHRLITVLFVLQLPC